MSKPPYEDAEDEPAVVVAVDDLFEAEAEGEGEAEDTFGFLDDHTTQSLVAAHIERAVAPYEVLLSASALSEMREHLRLLLVTDPVAIALLRRLRPRALMEESDKIDVRGFNGASLPHSGRRAK